MTSKEEVQQDYEEFGVEEILGQYMSNPYAEQIVRAHIKALELEVEHWRTIAESCECDEY